MTTIEEKYTAYAELLTAIETQQAQLSRLLATREQVVREARKSGANYQGLLQAGAPVTAQINEVEQAIRQNRNNADDAYYAYEQAKWNATPEELAQWEA